MTEEQNEELVFNPDLMNIGGEIETEEQKPKEKEEAPGLNLFNDTILDEEIAREKPTETDEESEKAKDKDKAPSPDSIKDTEESSLFSIVLGQELMEKGVLSEFDEEEIKEILKDGDEASAITHMIKKQIDSSAEELKSKYDQDYQEYLNMVQGGVPKQEANELVQLENYYGAIDEVDLKGDDDAAVQARKNVLTLNYRLNTKFSDEKISKLVERMYEDGSDIEEIDDAKNGLASYIVETKKARKQEAKNAEIRAEKEQQEQIENLKNLVETTEEYFEGDKVTAQVKKKMIKSLTTPVTLENGQPSTELWAKVSKNPAKFNVKLAYLEAIGFFEDKPLKKFTKEAETKATSKLQNYLSDNKGRSFKGSRKQSFNSDNASADPLADILGIS